MMAGFTRIHPIPRVIHQHEITVVWKYFVVKKILWVMKPTKIYYTKIF